MNKTGKIITVVILIATVCVVIAMKRSGDTSVAENSPKFPHLVDLGAGTCIPCKMMKPILDDLAQNYSERFQVTFIDVRENPNQAKKYNVKMIPTQVFYDADGNELFRHEGFYSQEDILGKWKELGINVEKAANDNGN